MPDPRLSEVINILPSASKGTRFALQNTQQSCNYLQATIYGSFGCNSYRIQKDN